MEYHPNQKFNMSDNSPLGIDPPLGLWRFFYFSFYDLPEELDYEDLAQKIYKIFQSLPGHFYFSPRHGITIICKMPETIILDDIAYKIKSLIKGDYMCRMGEQLMTPNGIISIQFLFSPTSDEKQRLSQEFIMQEKLNRQTDIIMVVEDDLFSRNIAVNALQSKFKVVEVSDGGKATQEYLAHSPDVLFLDIHLPNKKGPDILRDIL